MSRTQDTQVTNHPRSESFICTSEASLAAEDSAYRINGHRSRKCWVVKRIEYHEKKN
jgi:hypothetical protein